MKKLHGAEQKILLDQPFLMEFFVLKFKSLWFNTFLKVKSDYLSYQEHFVVEDLTWEQADDVAWLERGSNES